MKNKKLLLPLLAVPAVLWFAGCELNVNSKKASTASADASTSVTPATTPTTTPAPTPAPTPTPTPTPAPPATGQDQLDISNARNLGSHSNMRAQDARIDRVLYSADKSGDNVNLAFDPLDGWPTQGTSKVADAAVYIYWVQDGGVIGGYFDAHKVNQTSKGLVNIDGGYLDGHVPPSGAAIYFCLVSLDGAQRTNVEKSQTPW